MTPILASEKTAAKMLDLPRAEFLRLVEVGALPGWDFGRSAASGQFYVWNTGEGPASAMSNNEDPARAWLICILKALFATEDN